MELRANGHSLYKEDKTSKQPEADLEPSKEVV